MDLDEILKRAETQESDPSISSKANELLSQFNVSDIYICDRACENRACGHKLHPIAYQVISQ